MKIVSTKTFRKQLGRLRLKEQERVREALKAYVADYKSPPVRLRLHALRGSWKGYHSIAAGGDLRVHFLLVGETLMICAAVGSHSQLY